MENDRHTSRDQDVIGTLELIAEDVVTATGFFRNSNIQSEDLMMQNGVARTNCIDCLDRTNAAQFVIGKRALGHQLHALGVISDTSIDYDTDAVNLFTHMSVMIAGRIFLFLTIDCRYHDHGDTIAIQYGGSHLVNTMETYRKINQWTSHSRDMVESFKRYYNNSFLDKQRQEAYNLFLGNYKFVQGQPMLWDLTTDYYLHHADPRLWSGKSRKSYITWFTPDNLKIRELHKSTQSQGPLAGKSLSFFDDYWLEYYRPLAVSTFAKVFSYKMNSTFRYIPFKSTQDGRYDLSPFRVRATHDSDNPEKLRQRREVAIVTPKENAAMDQSAQAPLVISPTKHTELPNWLHSQLNGSVPPRPSIAGNVDSDVHSVGQTPKDIGSPSKPVKDKSAVTQWTLNQFYSNSLNPSVTDSEAYEYQRYISHPLSLPLVTTTDIPPNPNTVFLIHVNSSARDTMMSMHSNEDVADYTEFLNVGEDPLTVFETDAPKKRYKAYRQWLKGKSLFKQQRLDQ